MLASCKASSSREDGDWSLGGELKLQSSCFVGVGSLPDSLFVLVVLLPEALGMPLFESRDETASLPPPPMDAGGPSFSSTRENDASDAEDVDTVDIPLLFQMKK